MTERIILNTGDSGILIRRSGQGGGTASGEKLEAIFPAAVPPPEKGSPVALSSKGKTFRNGTAVQVKITGANAEFRQFLITIRQHPDPGKKRTLRKASPTRQEEKRE